MGVGVSPTPRPPITPGKTQYPLYRRLGGLQGRSGRAENLVPTGIRSRNVHSVVSRGVHIKFHENAARRGTTFQAFRHLHSLYQTYIILHN